MKDSADFVDFDPYRPISPPERPDPLDCGEACQNVYWKVAAKNNLVVLGGSWGARYLHGREPQFTEAISMDQVPGYQLIVPSYGNINPRYAGHFGPAGYPPKVFDLIYDRFSTGHGGLVSMGNCGWPCECVETSIVPVVAGPENIEFQQDIEWNQVMGKAIAPAQAVRRVAPPLADLRPIGPRVFDEECDVLEWQGPWVWGEGDLWHVVRRYAARVNYRMTYDILTVSGECKDPTMMREV